MGKMEKKRRQSFEYLPIWFIYAPDGGKSGKAPPPHLGQDYGAKELMEGGEINGDDYTNRDWPSIGKDYGENTGDLDPVVVECR